MKKVVNFLHTMYISLQMLSSMCRNKFRQHAMHFISVKPGPHHDLIANIKFKKRRHFIVFVARNSRIRFSYIEQRYSGNFRHILQDIYPYLVLMGEIFSAIYERRR